LKSDEGVRWSLFSELEAFGFRIIIEFLAESGRESDERSSVNEGDTLDKGSNVPVTFDLGAGRRNGDEVLDALVSEALKGDESEDKFS